jgi:hypothetical protein
MANEVIIMESDQQIRDALAEQYKDSKKNGIVSILECGKILSEAKKKLGHGSWGDFLNDVRVGESDRTAQRFMSIYYDFGHVLENPKQKTEALYHLGLSHLLELKKLPDRFKKEVEVVTVQEDGSEEREIVKVADVDKVAEFLQQDFTTESGPKKGVDLTASELKKAIKEAQGVYDASPDFEGSEEQADEDVASAQVIEKAGPTKVQLLMEKLIGLNDILLDVAKKCADLDLGAIAMSTDDDAAELKSELKKVKSSAEAVAVRSAEVIDKIHG